MFWLYSFINLYAVRVTKQMLAEFVRNTRFRASLPDQKPAVMEIIKASDLGTHIRTSSGYILFIYVLNRVHFRRQHYFN